MFELEGRALRLGASAADWTDAVRQAGALLVETGRVSPAYIDSMLKREAAAATSIGNGIAIPHGLRCDQGLVLHTGVVGFQYPAGLAWSGGETVRLVFAIAARDEEHVAFLSRLTDVALHGETAARLAATTDPAEFLALLGLDRAVRRAAVHRGAETEGEHFPYQRDLVVGASEGLHARPASIFAAIARKFGAEVRVRHGNRDANGKSVAALLRLGVPSGGTMRIMTRGEDGELALAALGEAVGQGLEGRDAFASPFLTVATPMAAVAEAGYAGACAKGIAAAPGVVVGKAQIVAADPTPDLPRDGAGPVVETARLNHALAVALDQIRDIHRTAIDQIGSDKAGIIEAQTDLVTDPGLIEDAQEHVKAGRSAEWAWRTVTEAAAEMIAALPNATLAARAADIRDMARRVMRVLDGTSTQRVVARHQASVLVADDLSPSETVGLDLQKVTALVTARGGPSSHTAILARAIGIPAVVGVGHDGVEAIAEGTMVIVDGDRGVVVAQPTIRDLGLAEHRRADREAELAASLALAYQPAFTSDGLRIEVLAGIGATAEAAAAVEAGAEGVGHIRTEAVFADRAAVPSEDEQREVYRALVRSVNGLPLSIRTLDPEGERRLTDGTARETNPLLGERGLRFGFSRPDLFAAQLRALAFAALEGPVRLLLPMVTTPGDIRKAKALVDAARKAVGGAPELTIAALIAVPSAAMVADRLASEVDFLAVDTDDLSQYALAVDRRHPRLAHLADALHPAVLRLIARTVEAAEAAGRRVGVSGTLASNARAVPLLVGLGVRELSAAVNNVPIVKQRVRELNAERCRVLAARALDCAEADDVRTLLWTEGL